MKGSVAVVVVGLPLLLALQAEPRRKSSRYDATASARVCGCKKQTVLLK